MQMTFFLNFCLRPHQSRDAMSRTPRSWACGALLMLFASVTQPFELPGAALRSAAGEFASGRRVALCPLLLRRLEPAVAAEAPRVGGRCVRMTATPEGGDEADRSTPSMRAAAYCPHAPVTGRGVHLTRPWPCSCHARSLSRLQARGYCHGQSQQGRRWGVGRTASRFLGARVPVRPLPSPLAPPALPCSPQRAPEHFISYRARAQAAGWAPWYQAAGKRAESYLLPARASLLVTWWSCLVRMRPCASAKSCPWLAGTSARLLFESLAVGCAWLGQQQTHLLRGD